MPALAPSHHCARPAAWQLAFSPRHAPSCEPVPAVSRAPGPTISNPMRPPHPPSRAVCPSRPSPLRLARAVPLPPARTISRVRHLSRTHCLSCTPSLLPSTIVLCLYIPSHGPLLPHTPVTALPCTMRPFRMPQQRRYECLWHHFMPQPLSVMPSPPSHAPRLSSVAPASLSVAPQPPSHSRMPRLVHRHLLRRCIAF
ncbi:hypothetical protein DENSPDRAFT_885448 [Dentipellis sp. KUC8613]|nr:hypothetical protein DENSPDRAFT_885448 [Dentipellis sp. KUC8613]